jgi:hypothetical protein
MATTIETDLKEVLGDIQKELREIRGDLNELKVLFGYLLILL